MTDATGLSRNGGGVPDQDVWLRQALAAIRRHWKLTVATAALVLVATAVFLATMTPIYEEATSLRISEKQPGISLGDMAVLPQLGGGSEIETELEVLRSRVIAHEVIDSLSLQLVLESPTDALREEVFQAIEVDPEAPAGEYRLERAADGRYRVEVEYEPEDADGLLSIFRSVVEPVGTFAAGAPIPLRGGTVVLAPGAAEHRELRFRVDELPDAVEEFRKATSVARPSREADLVVISNQGPDPGLVQAVPNMVARVFMARRRSIESSENARTVAFMEDQIRSLEVQITEAERALRAFRERNLVISPEAEASAQMERLAEMQGQRDLIAAEAVALAGLLREVEGGGPTEPGDSSAYRRLIAFPTLFRNPAASELLAQLAEVENERAKLLNRRTEEDVDVRVLTRRIGEIEAQLRSLATTYLQGLGEQVASLDSTLGGYRSELEVIPERQMDYGRLLRQATVLGEIYPLLQGRLKEAEIKLGIEDGSVRVVDPAVRPDEPVKPNIPLSLAFALVLGSALGLGAALLRDALDTTVRGRDDLQRSLGLTVLGTIPSAVDAGGNGTRRFPVPLKRGSGAAGGTGLPAVAEPDTPVAEAYHALQSNIAFAVPGRRPRALVFTSATPGDGSSMTAANLAGVLARQELDVLLVDADMRRGALHGLFNTEATPGLADAIRGTASFEEATRPVELGGGRLDFLAAGARPPNAAELLGSDRLAEQIERWRSRYDAILFDAPPLDRVTDAAILGARADGVVLVTRSGATHRAAVAYALEQLEHVRAPVLGTVLNGLDARETRGHASYAAAR
ncbi:MAG: GumC family protein [Gemmatimonadota bacterium]